MLPALIPKVILELPPSGAVSRAAVFPPWSSPSVHWELGLGCTHPPGKDCARFLSGGSPRLLARQSTQRSRGKNRNASLLLWSPIALHLSEFTNMYWMTIIITTIMNVFVSNVVPDTSPLLRPCPKQKDKHLFQSCRRNWLWKVSHPETVSTVLYEWKGFQRWFWLSFFFTSLPDARTQFPSKLPLHHQFSFWKSIRSIRSRSWLWVLCLGSLWGPTQSVTYRSIGLPWGRWGRVGGVSTEGSKLYCLWSQSASSYVLCIFTMAGFLLFWRRCC